MEISIPPTKNNLQSLCSPVLCIELKETINEHNSYDPFCTYVC